MAAVILILLFVEDQTAFDKWVEDGERVYRMHSTFTVPDRPIFRTIRSPGALSWGMPQNIPQIETFTRLMPISVIAIEEGNAFQETFTFVDPSFLDVFNLSFVSGSPDTALQDNNSIIISQDTARKYFGGEPALGQTLTFCCMANERVDFRVAGVFENIPRASHMDIDIAGRIVREWFTASPWMLESMTSVNVYTYFKLAPGASTEAVVQKIQTYLDENISMGDNPPPGLDKASDFFDVTLMAVPDIHLNAREQAADIGDMRPLGDLQTVYAFTLVAFLILFIAGINFMNLSTARATQRAREVSLRKVLGASRKQLVVQFLGESVVMTLIALVLSIALVELALPMYNAALDKELSFDILGRGWLIAALLGGGLVAGLISGFYPALVLSGYRPARILRANQSADPESSSSLRRVLVVLQFAISIALAIVTGIVYAQTLFAKNADLGYDHSNKLIVRNISRGDVVEVRDALIDDLLRLPNISAAIGSSEVPTDNNENNTGFTVLGRDDQVTLLNYISVDYDFFETYGTSPIVGRTFSRDFGMDEIGFPEAEDQSVQATVILNESAARRIGFDKPEDALGQVLLTDLRGRDAQLSIIGIVPDLQFRSVRYGTQPIAYYNNPDFRTVLTLQIEGGDMAAAIADVEAIWKRHVPFVPFSYRVLEDMINSQYAAEDAQMAMFGAFAALAMLIACLGLFGLAAFSVERRTKEIGIRKVLGARVVDIVGLLTFQFSKPVLIANLIAWPVAYYFMAEWLRGFENRIDLGPGYFVLAGFAALLIAWITVAGHAVRVARSNPIKALRYE